MEKVKVIAGASAWSDSAPPAPPAPPVPPAPGSPSIAPSAPTPTAILDDLVATVAGVRGAILASVDGFGLARSSSVANEAAHPAMLAAAVGLAHQLVEMGDGTTLRQVLVDHDGGLLLVWPVGGERILAVLADRAVDQRGVRTFVQHRTIELAEVAT